MNSIFTLITLAAFSGGSVPPFAKAALEVFGPFTMLFIRFFLGTVLLLPFIHKRKELSTKTFKNILGVSFIGALNPMLFFIALQFTQSTVTPIIYAAVPLMTVIYLRAIRKEVIPHQKLTGVLIGFVGVCITIALPLIESGTHNLSGFAGNLLILVAAFTFFLYGLFSKQKQRTLHISPIALTFYFCLVTTLLAIPFTIMEIVQTNPFTSAIHMRHIVASIWLGTVGTALTYVTYQKALQISSELTASLFTYLQPVATVFFAFILLSERITLPFIVGGVLAIIGAVKASHRPKV